MLTPSFLNYDYKMVCLSCQRAESATGKMTFMQPPQTWFF
jgi:hypothetical protein